jgi:hypothetical protein
VGLTAHFLLVLFSALSSDRSTSGHFVAHDYQQIETCISSFLVDLLGSKDGFRDQLGDQVKQIVGQTVDER